MLISNKKLTKLETGFIDLLSEEDARKINTTIITASVVMGLMSISIIYLLYKSISK